MKEDKALFHLLNWIDLEEGNRTLDEIVAYSSQWRPGTVFTRAELEQAAEDCLARGWVKILSAQDCEADRVRWQSDPNQNWSEANYQVGRVDFTDTGWTIFTKMVNRYQRRSPNETKDESTRYLWQTPGCVSILSLSEQELRRELAAVRAGQDELTGGGLSAEHRVGEIVGPYLIGPWWVKRFLKASVGYRLDIFFSPPDINL